MLFVIEEETKPSRFSIHRLAHYCLDLAELFETDRVVPVVIFLNKGQHATELTLGGDRHRYLQFRYLSCDLGNLPFERYKESDATYAALDDNELQVYQDRYPEETEKVSNFAERFRAEGMQQGIEKGMRQGMQQGEALALECQLTLKFGELPEAVRQRIAGADADTLITWLERVLTANSIDEVLG